MSSKASAACGHHTAWSRLRGHGGRSRRLRLCGRHSSLPHRTHDHLPGTPAGTLAAATGQLLACDDAIVFEDAVVVTPGNATLVHDLSLRVPAGTNLLVTGPNGAGKSSLFRWAGADGGPQLVLASSM